MYICPALYGTHAWYTSHLHVNIWYIHMYVYTDVACRKYMCICVIYVYIACALSNWCVLYSLHTYIFVYMIYIHLYVYVWYTLCIHSYLYIWYIYIYEFIEWASRNSYLVSFLCICIRVYICIFIHVYVHLFTWLEDKGFQDLKPGAFLM